MTGVEDPAPQLVEVLEQGHPGQLVARILTVVRQLVDR